MLYSCTHIATEGVKGLKCCGVASVSHQSVSEFQSSIGSP